MSGRPPLHPPPTPPPPPPLHLQTPHPTNPGSPPKNPPSTTSPALCEISNSTNSARPVSSPKFAIKYRNPNAACGYFAFNVANTISGIVPHPTPPHPHLARGDHTPGDARTPTTNTRAQA